MQGSWQRQQAKGKENWQNRSWEWLWKSNSYDVNGNDITGLHSVLQVLREACSERGCKQAWYS